MSGTIRLATRKSALALAQSRQVARRLEALEPGLRVEEVQVVTQGDRVQDRPLSEIGGKGLFVAEIEAALAEGRADLAVHSMKDLPAALAEGMVLAAVPTRASPWDLLITRDGANLEALPQGAHVGTSSQRRALQLHALRPDLRISMLRGNIDTRLRRLEEGAFDAIVLAEAGVSRLGVTVKGVRLAGRLVPAVGQGALALECRADDAYACRVVGLLDDAVTRRETDAERALMRALGGSCTVPLGAHAVWGADGADMAMEGFYAREDGAQARATVTGDGRTEADAAALGAALGAKLRAAVGLA